MIILDLNLDWKLAERDILRITEWIFLNSDNTASGKTDEETWMFVWAKKNFNIFDYIYTYTGKLW